MTSAKLPASRRTFSIKSVWAFVIAGIVLVGILFGTRIYVDYQRMINRAGQRLLAEWQMDAGIELLIYLAFVVSAIVITGIMLRRKVELERLDKIQAHLAAIIESSDDAIISKDLNGIIRSWNTGAERLFAYPAGEVVGQSITMLIPPERQDEENNILSRLKAGERIEHFETVRISKEGRQIDVSITSSPVKDSSGTIIGASKIIRDITERKQAEQELQKREQQLQVAYENLQLANEELQAQSEELQAQSEELQAQHEELQTQSEELQDQNAELVRLWEQSRQAGTALQMAHDELELRVRERTSELEEAVDILQVEIEERRKAEGNLARINNLYSVLSETNQTIVRSDNHIDLFSEFCRISVEHGGFSLAWVGVADEADGAIRLVAADGKAGVTPDEIRMMPTDGTVEGPVAIAIRQGTYYISNDFQSDPCTAHWHKQARAYGINASATVALKEDGRVIGALTLCSEEKEYFDKQHVDLLLQMGLDISFALDNFNREAKRRQADKELREKDQMLVQQSRQAAMGEMIGNVAHQWRQPLNTLGLFNQRLGMFYGTPKFTPEFLENSVGKTMEIIQHMSKTIDDFRNYFRPDKEKVEFNVCDTIDSTMSLLEGSFQNPKIHVDIATSDVPHIYGYKNEFAQVILNIMVNARDAIISKEIKNGRVNITVCNEDECAVITIADNAGGIPEEILDKVFDPYFTTKGPQQGTGVGLFMSKNIIEKNMNGNLIVRNTSEGAEFRILVR